MTPLPVELPLVPVPIRIAPTLPLVPPIRHPHHDPLLALPCMVQSPHDTDSSPPGNPKEREASYQADMLQPNVLMRTVT